MREEGLVLLVVFLGTLALTGVLVYTYHRRKRDLIQARMQLQTRILDRFDSAQDFAGFLESEGGRRFLAGLSDERGWRPARRIVNGVSVGLVLVALSAAFFIMALVESERHIAFPGVITLALGLGFLAASWASHRLSKAWGLIDGDGEATVRRLGLEPPAIGGRHDAGGGEV